MISLLDTTDIGVLVAGLGIVVGLIRMLVTGTNKRVDAVQKGQEDLKLGIAHCETRIAKNSVRIVQVAKHIRDVSKNQLGFQTNPHEPFRGEMWDMKSVLSELEKAKAKVKHYEDRQKRRA